MVPTSLAGFEALIRGKPVTVHGQPFYSGWGLTEDLAPPPRRARQLAVEELEKIALVVDLREAVHDRHAIDFLVVLRLRVSAGEVLEDGRPNLDTVVGPQLRLFRNLRFVDVRPIRGSVVHGVPATAPRFEEGVSTRNGVPL